MFRVVSEYLRIAATSDGYLNGITYEKYKQLCSDPKVKSFLPKASDSEAFMNEMQKQTYKLGMLNDQISEADAIASVRELIYTC